MLERLAAWILETYIGKYVDLNVNKLSVGLLSGVVELENVPLKPSAFNETNADLAFELKFGYISKIKLNVSLNRLRYTPWLLVAENIYVIIGPKTIKTDKKRKKKKSENQKVHSEAHLVNEGEDEEEEEDELQIEKEFKWLNYEKKWFKEVELLGNNSKIKSVEENKSLLSSMFGPMFYSLLKNIHVDLNNIHIRYEDCVNKFSLGLNISSLSIRNDETSSASEDINNSTNNEQQKNQQNLANKLCELKMFSIYTDSSIILENSTTQDNDNRQMIFDRMNFFEKVEGPQKSSASFKYLIRPTSFRAQLIRDMSHEPLRKRNRPRLRVLSHVQHLELHFDQKQISYFAHIKQSISVYKNQVLCVHLLRPEKSEIKAKWLYLFNCVRLLIKKKSKEFTANELVQWSRDCILYRKIYERVLNQRLRHEDKSSSSSNNIEQQTIELNIEEDKKNTEEEEENKLLLDWQQEQKRIESNWSFKRLLALRRCIFEIYIKTSPLFKQHLLIQKLKNNKSTTALISDEVNSNMGIYGYMSWRLSSIKEYYWTGTETTTKTTDDTVNNSGTSPDQIDQEVLALISDSLENDSLFRRDSVLVNLEFKLESASITLSRCVPHTEMDQQLAAVKLEQSTLLFEALPRHDSFFVEVDLSSFYLLDLSNSSNNKDQANNDDDDEKSFQMLIYPKQQQNESSSINSSTNNKTSVLHIIYEHKQLLTQQQQKTLLNNNSRCACLQINSAGLDAIYSFPFIKRMLDYCQMLNEYFLNCSLKVSRKRRNSINNSINNSNNKQSTNDNQLVILPSMHFDFEILAPKIIFPEQFLFQNLKKKRRKQIRNKKPQMVIFDFGQLTFSNQILNKQKLQSRITLTETSSVNKPSLIINTSSSILLKKSHTQTNLSVGRTNNSPNLRRNSDSKLVWTLENPNETKEGEDEVDEEDNSDEDIYETPIGTPPNEMNEEMEIKKDEEVEEQKPPSSLYTVYDLQMNELQIIIGQHSADNLQGYLNRGHSQLHLIEKFNVHFQIEIKKKNRRPLMDMNGEEAPLKINTSIKLIRLHIDDYKLIHIYRTVESIRSLGNSQQKTDNIPFFINNQNQKLNEDLTPLKNRKYIVNLKVNEVNMTMSVSAKAEEEEEDEESIKSEEEKESIIIEPNNTLLSSSSSTSSLSSSSMILLNEDQEIGEFKSICELKIYEVTVAIESLKEKVMDDITLIQFRIFNLLLIDARQIYGTDYQLLAASHPLIRLDAQTGRIIDNYTINPQQSPLSLTPLININLSIRNRDYSTNVSFSTLDIILNPETISKIIILFYDVYLNLNSSKEVEKEKETLESIESESYSSTLSSTSESKVNFEFSRLSVLIFQVVNDNEDNIHLNHENKHISRQDSQPLLLRAPPEKASNVASLVLNGAQLQMQLKAELFELDAQLNGLIVSDLTIKNKKSKQHQCIFTINKTEQDKQIFEISYKKRKNDGELMIRMASLCYQHSARFVYDIQCCFGEFLRLHARLMDELTDKAARIAFNMFKKGKTYLQNTIADIYQNDEMLPLMTEEPDKKKKKENINKQTTKRMNVHIHLQTPVVAVPMRVNSDQLLVAHLGNIEITNRKEDEEEMISNLTRFSLQLEKISLFSVDLGKEEKREKEENSDLFRILLKPKFAQKLIDEINIKTRVDYLPKFNSDNTSGIGSLRLRSQILNKCRITLSKMQLEQLIKTVDNIVYKEEQQRKEESEVKKCIDIKTSNEEDLDNEESFLSSSSFLKQNQVPLSSSITSTPTNQTPRHYSSNMTQTTKKREHQQSLSSFKILYDEFSKLQDDLKADLHVNAQFKMESLFIQFLGESTATSRFKMKQQKIAELCFNDYQLEINKTERFTTSVDMTLKSLYLIDKLEEEEEEKEMNNTIYLLTSNTISGCSKQLTHTCSSKWTSNVKYDSFSLPNRKKKKLNDEDTRTMNDLNHFFELNRFYKKLNNPLPNEIAKNRDDPNPPSSTSTPPSSPTTNRRKLIMDQEEILKKKHSESAINLQCIACLNEMQSPLLAEIRIIFIDQNQKNNNEQMNEKQQPKKNKNNFLLNKFIKLKFSDLQLNVNPETWILLLDVLGLGSKVYPTETNKQQQQILAKSSFLFKHPLPKTPMQSMSLSLISNSYENNPLVPSNLPSNTAIEFEVKNFTIHLLNRNSSSSLKKKKISKLAKFCVSQVEAFVESTADYMKMRGTLGSLSIYDLSRQIKTDQNTLFSERFLTSGEQALEFEFFKYNNNKNSSDTNAFDQSLKLRMSSVKYVHIQLFVIQLTNYFQQFQHLQDALSKMRALEDLIITMDSTEIMQQMLVARRGSRIHLDIRAQTPILCMPIDHQSVHCLILYLGNITVTNRFALDGDKGTLTSMQQQKKKRSGSLSSSDEPPSSLSSLCLLDILNIQLTDTDLYSALRLDNKDKRKMSEKDGKLIPFPTFTCVQQLDDRILKEEQLQLNIHLERNLDQELSRRSPDWSAHATLTACTFALTLEQYKLIRGLLDHNIGEKPKRPLNRKPEPKQQQEMTLTSEDAEVWKSISILIDLENVGIELIQLKDNKKCSLAYLAFISSSLLYESSSNESKLTDLVSTEIIITDTRQTKDNAFVQILKNNNCKQQQRLQLEIHYRSNAQANRYSILINNCRLMVIIDWLLMVKDFLISNADKLQQDEEIEEEEDEELIIDDNSITIEDRLLIEEKPNEVKMNLSNSDFVLLENWADVKSEAVILRLTAFGEYSQKPRGIGGNDLPFQCRIQTIDLFSCQMSAIEDTTLSIIDSASFSILLKSKTGTGSNFASSSNLNELKDNKQISPGANIDYLLEVTTEQLRLHFSYLDFRFFLRLFNAISKQCESTVNNKEKEENQETEFEVSQIKKSDNAVDQQNNYFFISTINVNIDTLCLCIIDDCKDVDIPLIDIQFTRFKLTHLRKKKQFSTLQATTMETSENRNRTNSSNSPVFSEGSTEFALNIDFYNRLLSGWEPLLEPYLARVHWKLKEASNCFTVTSMDVLNLNVTNPFCELIAGVIVNWRDDYNNTSNNSNNNVVSSLNKKRHEIFRPYSLLNLTGQTIKFCTFQDNTPNLTASSSQLAEQFLKTNSTSSSVNDLDWQTVEDKCSKQFSFFHSRLMTEITVPVQLEQSSNGKQQFRTAHSYQQQRRRQLIQHRIKVKLDSTSNEIRPLTIDKVGTYFRDISTLDNRGQRGVTRLLFDISLSSNSATKLIEIKSPVSIRNDLQYSVQCRIEKRKMKESLESSKEETEDEDEDISLGPLLIEIEPQREITIPIKYLPCDMWFRPLLHHHIQRKNSSDEDWDQEEDEEEKAEFTAQPVTFVNVSQPGQVEYIQAGCRLVAPTTMSEEELKKEDECIKPVKMLMKKEKKKKQSPEGEKFFYFFVKIKRHNYNDNGLGQTQSFLKKKSKSGQIIPGHAITLEPTFTLHNLLPIELRYKFIPQQKKASTDQQQQQNVINGKLDSYKCEHFHNLNVCNSIDLLIDIENFRMVKAIEINPQKHLQPHLNKQKQQQQQEEAELTKKNAMALVTYKKRMSSSGSSIETLDTNETMINNNNTNEQSTVKSTRTANNNAFLQSNRKLTILRRVNFFDEQNRPLFLIARIMFKIGSGCLLFNNDQDTTSQNSSTTSNENNLSDLSDQLHFNSCPIVVNLSSVYCFFNLTGLPLIFRQYNCQEAAGQLEEHEMGRSSEPLLFSYNDVDSPYACSMRIGKLCKDFKSYLNNKPKSTQNKSIVPKWCKPFGLDSGSSYRALYVINNTVTTTTTTNNTSTNKDKGKEGDSFSEYKEDDDYLSQSSSSVSYLHPDWVYYIGIEIKPGKGLLKDTIYVYFSTRYYLVNVSGQHLHIAQYFSIQKQREQLLHRRRSIWPSAKQHQENPIGTSTSAQITYEKIKNNEDISKEESCLSSSSQEHSIFLMKDSMTQFHWARTDRDQLLSVRLALADSTSSSYNWSGGFKIDTVDSFYVNMRNRSSNTNAPDFTLLKVEVILDGGTFFVIFSEVDRRHFPMPIRLYNGSQVPVFCCQSATATNAIDQQYALTLRPGQMLDYAWDEPIGEKKLLLGVGRDNQMLSSIESSGIQLLDFNTNNSNNNSIERRFLYYENFVYIVFTEEDKEEDSRLLPRRLIEDEKPLLVLTAALDQSDGRVFVQCRESGNRNQLWHLTVDGLLVHEGSSPPNELLLTHNRQYNASIVDVQNRYVLDIEDMAPQPNRQLYLQLRRVDKRRQNTQLWQLTRDGGLRCRVQNMGVQLMPPPNDPLPPLRFKNSSKRNVVLGPIVKEDNTKISCERLRPGSGHLCVELFTDGPTKVIHIRDIKDYDQNNKSHKNVSWQKANRSHLLDKDNNEEEVEEEKRKIVMNKSFELYVNFSGGIGVSVIQWLDQEYEELLYAYLKSFELNVEHSRTRQEQLFTCSIQSIQVCNQLINSMKKNLLYIVPSVTTTSATSNPESAKPSAALHIDFVRHFKYKNLVTVKHLLITVAPDVTLQIEERLLWKCIQFIGSAKVFHATPPPTQFNEMLIQQQQQQNSSETISSSDLNHLQNTSEPDTIANFYYKTQLRQLIAQSKATKYSFNRLHIAPITMQLSVYKQTIRLADDLQRIKTQLGIPLIQFENARIELQAFVLQNEHDSAHSLLQLMRKHYTQELRAHAIHILGSVDFLGNPLGLVVDFKESLSNVLSNGQVTDFVFSITHGVANSVSKFSSSLSDELNELTMDQRYQETREQIRSAYNQGSIDHFVGGALGFAIGVVGGALSLATQTYRGFNENGVSGAFVGLGRGAVGTISKPLVGVLDLATGIAAAIRETSKAVYKNELPRIREGRSCATPGSLLAPFSRADADGQKILYEVNQFSMDEKFIALEQLNNLSEPIIGLVTNQRVIFLKSCEFDYRTLYEITYVELQSMNVIEEEQFTYLELTLTSNSGSGLNRPRFKFENRQIAYSLAKKIRFAKENYDETFYILHNYKEEEE